MKRRHFIKITLPLALTGKLTAKTHNPKEPILQFGVIADPQYADKDSLGKRHYRQSLQKLKNSIHDFNKQPLDFVVTLGDVIDTDLKSFAKIMPIYENMRAPYRVVLGNHDFEVAEDDKVKVLKVIKIKTPYHSEVVKGWRFIYLDSTDQSMFRYPKGDLRYKEAKKTLGKLTKKKLPQAQPWNGGFGKKQMQWFKKELVAATKAHQPVIIFNHNPVYPKNAHNLWNDEEVVQIISKNNHVVAYMNGHNHQGHYAEHEMCHYLNFKGMVESNDASNAYAVVKCFTDRIEVDGIGWEPDRNLTRKG